MGKDRRGVTVITHPQQDEVELRQSVVGLSDDFAYLLFVAHAFFGGGGLTVDAVDVFSRDFGGREKKLVGDPVIALRVGRRDASFIAPKEMDSGPIDFVGVGIGPTLKQNFRRAAARQRDRDGGLVEGLGPSGEIVCESGGKGGRIGKGFESAIHKVNYSCNRNALRNQPVSVVST